MPRPNLIHPVWLTIERLVQADMVMDDGAREPFHGTRTNAANTVTIPAQIQWEKQDDPDQEGLGVREMSSGYILCRIHDLNTYLGDGGRLGRGDRITTSGHMTGLDLFITGKDPKGHYPDQDGATLVKYHFMDRKPAHGT